MGFPHRGVTRRRLLQGSTLAAAGLALPVRGGFAQTPAVSDISGEFKAISWETEAEMRKWFLHTDKFFSTRYPNLKPEIEYGIAFGDYWTKLQTTIAGGAQLDMCWMHNSRLQSYAQLGMIQSMDNWIAASPPQDWPAGYYTSQVEGFQYNGQQYAIPYDWASGGLYVNLDMLQKAGVETPTENTTFDQLLEMGQKIKAAAADPANSWGFQLPTASHTTSWIVKGFGGKQFTADPLTPHFDDPNTIAAYQYLYDAIWTHGVMPQPAALEGTGLTPQVAFASGLLGLIYSLNDDAFVFGEIVGDKAKWTVAPTPRGPGGRFQMVGGSGFSVPSTAKYPDISYEYLKFMATDLANLPTTAKMGSMFVSRKDQWDQALPDPAELDPEAYKNVFYTLGERDGEPPLYFPGYQQWDASIYTRYMDQLWANATSDVAGVCQQIQEETVALLASMAG